MPNTSIPGTFSISRIKSNTTIDELISFLSTIKTKHGNLYVDYNNNGNGLPISSAIIVRDSLDSDCKPTLRLGFTIQ